MNILKTYTQTSGCITIVLGLAIASGISILPSDDGKIDAVTSDTGIVEAANGPTAIIDTDIINNTDISVQTLSSSITVSCGLVCTVGTESFLILCSSDADLLTINEEYLTITRV